MSATTSSAPSGTSYTEKLINVTITLGTGTFGQTGKNTDKLTGHRVTASIAKAGSPSWDSANIQIYGVLPSTMNAVSTLGVPFAMTRLNNVVTVEAGDTVNGMAVVYQGAIKNAWQNFDDAPETFLNISGIGAKIQAMTPVPPTSLPGTADVATVMAGLAAQMGWAFENNGVSVKIPSPYLPGTALEQAYSLARTANIEVYPDTGASPNILAIWPKNKTRSGTIPLISAATGLIGYPEFNDLGMSFRCLLNTNIRVGGQIMMQSSLGGAPAPASGATQEQAQKAGPNGTWFVRGPVVYDLASQVVGGPWFCDVTCTRTLGG